MNAKTVINVYVCGADGRMGRRLIGLIADDEELKLIAATEHPDSPVMGADAGLNAGAPQLSVSITPGLKRALERTRQGVIIDFSSPSSTLENLRHASEYGVALLIGTTGFDDDQLAVIREASKKIPVLLAPNMSIGMNAVFRLVAEASRILNRDCDIEVLDFHHKEKTDAPSGTALKLAGIVSENSGRSFPEAMRLDRRGGPRGKDEIGVQVLRGGDVVGEHTVYFCGKGERVEIRHVASDRAAFASGALRAAKWLNGRPAGLYNMENVLNDR